MSAAGSWTLAAGCRQRAAGSWMLDVGCRLLDVGSGQRAVGCWMSAVGRWMLDVGSGQRDVGCWLLDVGRWQRGLWKAPDGARREKRSNQKACQPGGGVAMARVSPADCQGVRVHPDEYGYRIPLGRQSASPCRVAAVRSFNLVNRPILKQPIMPKREE